MLNPRLYWYYCFVLYACLFSFRISTNLRYFSNPLFAIFHDSLPLQNQRRQYFLSSRSYYLKCMFSAQLNSSLLVSQQLSFSSWHPIQLVFPSKEQQLFFLKNFWPSVSCYLSTSNMHSSGSLFVFCWLTQYQDNSQLYPSFNSQQSTLK